jgi:tetratricopeptide (TPR) repeat protein
LRRLGKAYLDQKDTTRAAAILDEIQMLDHDAYERNSENAALKARYFEAAHNLSGARDVLATALAKIPSSYYLGDRLGQVLIKLGEISRAKEVYQQVSRILTELREQNVWTYATTLTAAIVLQDAGAMDAALQGLHATRPSRDELETIERGVGTLVASLGREAAVLPRLRDIQTRQ